MAGDSSAPKPSPCKLCGELRTLRLSHILPAFVFKWQRETSGSGHIRNSAQPNLRVQDGTKRHWLCDECEQRFSAFEREFATHLFHPYTQRSGQNFPYGPWLLKFCASVSWRVLLLSLEEGDMTAWDAAAVERCRAAEERWRDFLMGRTPHPGAARQQLVPFDPPETKTADMAPNINRYLMRSIGMDLCRNGDAIYTFAKLGRFVIMGMVHEPRPQAWKGAAVNANGGVVGPKSYVLPDTLWGYLNGQARKSALALANVSPTQRALIDKTFRSNIDRLVGSDLFDAMQADIDMFGDDAKDPGPTRDGS